jgi:lipoprotein-anchoring transpeptidase ErfK/SrfK
MHRWKWAVVLLLIIASTFILSFSYDQADGPAQFALPSPTANPSPVAAPTGPPPTLEPTETPLPTATATAPFSVAPTLANTPTATVTTAITATLGVTVTATPWPFDMRADLPRYLYIDQDTQYLYVFENGVLLRDIPCSTGLPLSNTYTPAWSGVVGDYWGTFFAYGVYADEAWYLFKSDGSILIHSLPYTLTAENGRKEYQDADALGVRPASHGCIRLAPEDAAWLTAWNPKGTPITITALDRAKWLP